MDETNRSEGPGPGRGGRLARYSFAWLAGALPAFAIITLLWLHAGRTAPFGDLALGAFALAFPVLVRRLDVPRRTGFVDFLLVVGVAFAIVSILTGWGNGLTDEPFTTPRFAYFVLAGHNPYTTQMVFDYTQYGKVLPSQSYYLYLPLLMFLQIPGISYKWFSLGCWVLLVLLLRHRFDAAVLMAQPYAMLVAASGYNDPVVLLLLTAGFVGFRGQRQKWAEYLALGCKQFANVLVFAYYLVRRDWKNVLGTGIVSAAFLAPFYVWGGPAILCPAVFADRLPGCTHGFGAGILLNYPLWAVWAVAIFFGGAWSRLRAGFSRWWPASRRGRRESDRARVDRLPSVVVVGASAIAAGLAVFVTAWVLLGASVPADLVAAALAGVASGMWMWAWGGPWPFERAPVGRSAPAIRRFVALQLLAVAINLAVVAVGLAAGAARLAGEAVGLGLGTLVATALAFAGGLYLPAGSPPGGAVPTPVPGNAGDRVPTPST